MLSDLPVLGVCGWSGSGKTTLIEEIVRNLRGRGLDVAVVKHDAHAPDVDRPGKDSDRFFRAGADVALQSGEEQFLRIHPRADVRLEDTLFRLALRHDIVLVEGYKETMLPKVWLLGEGEEEPPADVDGILSVLPRGVERAGRMLCILDDWLPQQWTRMPVFGCVLIGGESRRMGRPKHLIEKNGVTWLERTVGMLSKACRRVVISGRGEVPPPLSGHTRLPDVPEAEGPMAGILAAMRWAPNASWLVAACDLPDLSAGALEWLLSTRAPGVWATLPRLRSNRGIEPLLAHYDFRARDLLEGLVASGEFRVNRVVMSKVISPNPPLELEPCWDNVNEEASLKSGSSGTGA